MTRSIRLVAASLVALCSLSGLTTLAQTAKPSASPSPVSKMGGNMNTPGGKPGKKMPARDPKTGKFVKGGVANANKNPARDPKTGRFLKASPAPAAPKM